MKRRPLIASLASTLAAILILAAGCSEQPPTATRLEPTPPEAARGGVGRKAMVVRLHDQVPSEIAKVITPAGGRIDFGIGHIVFPAGSVRAHTRITARTDGATLAVAFEPHGLRFPEGREPILSFRHDGVTDISGTLQILYVDGSRAVIEALPTKTDIAKSVYTAPLRHFSGYLLGSW